MVLVAACCSVANSPVGHIVFSLLQQQQREASGSTAGPKHDSDSADLASASHTHQPQAETAASSPAYPPCVAHCLWQGQPAHVWMQQASVGLQYCDVTCSLAISGLILLGLQAFLAASAVAYGALAGLLGTQLPPVASAVCLCQACIQTIPSASNSAALLLAETDRQQ